MEINENRSIFKKNNRSFFYEITTIIVNVLDPKVTIFSFALSLIQKVDINENMKYQRFNEYHRNDMMYNLV